ncbi:MAG: methylmalonyl-CoA mutase small subunit, partial [Bacteroidales bacterium]|nr:methylmalonyl-CoA mutase small subunit [Bacteroidales bacterium]
MEEKLFTLFPPVSTEEWEEAIKNDLKGADYDKKLVWKTDENIAVRPYYRAENLENLFHLAWNGTFPFAKDNGADWKVRQDFIVDDMGTV